MQTQERSSCLSGLRRIVLGILAVLIVGVAILAGIIIYDTNFGATTADVSNVTYAGEEETTLQGYLVRPEGAGAHPALLLLHEWWAER